MKNIMIYVGQEALRNSAGRPRQLRQLTEFSVKYDKVFYLNQGKLIPFEQDVFLSTDNHNKKSKLNFTLPIKLKNFFRKLKHDFLYDQLHPMAWLTLLKIRKVKKQYLGANIEVFYSSPTFPLFPVSPYHIDLRDPFATHPNLSHLTFHRRYIERSVLKGAICVSTACKYLADEVSDLYGVTAKCIYNYPNLHSSEYNIQTIDQFKLIDPDFFNIKKNYNVCVFTGSMPENFYDFASIKYKLNKLLDAEKRLYVMFIGPELHNRLQFNHVRVGYRDKVTHNIAYNYQFFANELLLCGHLFDGYVTMKVFEYIAHCKKIYLLDFKKRAENEIIELIENSNSTHEVV